MTRLPTEQLFRIGPDGLEPIGDETLELRLSIAARTEMRPAYPESTFSQTEPCEAV